MGFVENVNKVANGLTDNVVTAVDTVASDIANIDAVATNLDSINLVADNVVPNIEVILASENNANIATAQAIIATTKANESLASAESASASATSANTSAINASASELNANNSAIDANNSKLDAALSATSAGLSAASASASELTAIAQAGIATDKASEASVSAENALTSANNANTSAINAANSASDSAASALSAAASYDSFDDRYLGSKTVAPTTDNDGNTLLEGALYWNSITKSLYVWTGTAWSQAVFNIGGMISVDSISTLTNKTIDDISNTVGADHIHYKVKATANISSGQVVKITGYNSGEDAVEAQPVSSTSDIAVGIAEEDIANGSFGLITNTGMIEGINTSSWSFGTILYSNGSGGLTSVKPTSGIYQACAVVLRQNSNTGALLVEFTEPKPIASTTQSGYVQLNNTLTSTSTVQALTAAQGKVLQDGKQPLDATLTALAGVATSADKYIYATGSDTFTTGTITSFGRSLVDDVDASTARGTLGLGSIATQNANTINITGGSISGITDLAIADGGTGASDAANARTNLGISATNTPFIPAGNITATNVQAAVQELDSEKAPLVSPALTGIPTAPTAAVGTNTTQVATTEFVQSEIANDTFSKTELVMAIGNINSPLLDMPLKNSLAMKAGVGSATFTRASTATYIDRYGVLKTAAIDEPRFEKEGYLNEGASTNLLTYSERLWDTAYWAVGTTLSNFYTVTNETGLASQYGIVDSKVAKFVANATTSSLFLRKTGLSLSAIDYSTSIFVYVPTQAGITSWQISNDFNDTDLSSVTVSYAFDKWVRISTSKLLTSTRTQVDFNIAANGVVPTSGFTFYAFGAQLEALPFATSYIPTTSAAVTRSADVLKVTPTDNFPLNEGSIVVDFDTLGVPSIDQRIIQYHTGTSNANSYSLGLNAGDNKWESYTNGVAAIVDVGILPNTKYRLCSTGSNNSLQKRYKDGVLFNTASSIYWQSILNTTLTIGSLNGSSGFLYGHISNIRIYDKALTAQEAALA